MPSLDLFGETKQNSTMAITRTQQAKQMLQDGGRIGFQGGGADAGGKKSPGGGTYKSPTKQSTYREEVEDEIFTPGPGGGDDRREVRDDPTTFPTGGDDGGTIPRDRPLKKPEETRSQKFKRQVKKLSPFSFLERLGTSKLARINNALQRQKYIDSLDLTDPKEKEEYDRIMNQLGGLGMDIIGGPKVIGETTVPPSMGFKDPLFEMPQAPPGMLKTNFKIEDGVSALGDPGVKDVLGEGYEEYLNRFNIEDTGGDDPSEPLDPCLGPNPPAYCFPKEKDPEDPTPKRNLAGLTPRIGGSIFDFDQFAADGGRIGAMNGGIMNVDDLDREAFLLGGIAKGIKKAVRGVKKLAKSPIGKAAILGAVGFGLGSKGALGSFFGKGSFNPFLRKVAGDTAFSGLGSILSKAGLVSKAGLPTFKGGIALASILPLLAGKQDDEFDIDAYYASQKLEPATTARQAGSEFDFYNYNLAEGGTPRKEPVAKKVMPLLDMGGMEKDYRAEGGFVPIGRMEKADDVPARLSKNEFVFTADAVRNAGDGDVDKGAEVMYNMMKNLEAGGEVSEESQGLDGAREMFQTSQRLGEVI